MIRQSTLVFLLLAGALSLALFVVKYQFQDLEQELAALHRDIQAETRAAHVLRAEWANLNDPVRIGKLAQRHLGMGELSAAQIVAANDVATLVLQERPVFAAKPRMGDDTPAGRTAAAKPVPATRADKPRYSFSDIEKLLSRHKVSR